MIDYSLEYRLNASEGIAEINIHDDNNTMLIEYHNNSSKLKDEVNDDSEILKNEINDNEVMWLGIKDLIMKI